MAKRICKCLNVVLNINEKETEEVDGKGLLGTDENVSDEDVDEFFNGHLLLVKLAFAGVEVQQQILMKTRTVGDYKIYKCLNCGLSTHAIHTFKGLERVVISKDLLGESSYDKMRQSETFSTAFKIVLNDLSSDGSPKHGNGSQLQMFQRSLSDANSEVNDIVKKYLAFEEQAMNERIRIHTEQQRDIFEKLQEKVKIDKQKFLRLINKNEQNALQSSISDAMEDMKLVKKESIDSDSEEPSSSLPQFKGRKQRPRRSIPIVASSLPSNRAPSRVLTQQAASSLDNNQRSKMKMRQKFRKEDDTLFDFDGFNENRSCEPFFESDEDSSGDSSSLGNSGGFDFTSNRGSSNKNRIYATSVPVSIPMYREPLHGSFEERSYIDSEPAPSPERMAESIKALARSLHDSTSIFGELPGPRYNTMPYH